MVRLLGDLYVVSGDRLTHPWDASAYLISGPEPVMIDCGGTLGYDNLKAGLAELGLKPSDIKRVYATHGHWDHVAALAQLRAESDAQFFIHQADREQVETGDWDLTSAFLYDQPFPPVEMNGTIDDGEVLRLGAYEFRVVHTPGHSPGSVCFIGEVAGMKLLIAGDTLWGGFHSRVRSNIDDWHHSMERLVAEDFEVTTIGHCPPALIYEAKEKVLEAQQQLGVYFNPWFKPFHTKFKY